MGGAPALLAFAACVSLCLRVSGQPNEQRSDEITLEREQIFVNLEDGTTFGLMIEPDDSVQNLFGDIYEHEGVPGFRMQLQVGETRLNITANLSDYKFRAGTRVALVVPEDGGRYMTEFAVKTRDGRELPVAIPLDITVASLKASITQWTGIPKAEQRLLLRGKELKDERKLMQYGVNNGTTLNLGAPLEDCRQVAKISVKTPSGASIGVEVNLADTVADLKEKIWQIGGVPVGVQRLAHSERVITGEDHLCDLGLEAGSIVYMFLYSSQITSADQVARLREPPVACSINPHRAPIFREAGDVAELVRNGRRSVSHYKNAHNWVLHSESRPGWDPRLFDPIAHLTPNPDNEQAILQYSRTAEILSHPDACEMDRIEAVILKAQIRLSSAVRPYLLAANLASVKHDKWRLQPGITLGGGFTDSNLVQLVSLGADVNNWAPDAFDDSSVIRLFEVAERVRQVLARGGGTLSIASQRRINLGILSNYLAALAGYPQSVECKQPREDEECGICRDSLTAEPAIRLPCEHAFHADCVHSWATDVSHAKYAPTCPSCRQRFTISYDTLGRAELETLELQAHQD